jgi:sterol desaturase/sphingolipid hydroxylase (fatty acid hydroxylase superfamily)
MTDAILHAEPLIRLAAFAGVFALMAAWEVLAPRRAQSLPRARRWPSNLGILALDAALVRVLFPVAAVGAALWAEARGIGLFQLLAMPGWLAVPLGVVLLDLAIWAQHLVFHHVPLLWRLHRMHHADTEFDVTTGLRFHPVEIVLSMLIKIAIVVALGLPAVAVVLFEVLLNATSQFSHGNVRMPAGLERGLRRLVVTPEMHRVHHSIHRHEHNSNFGFCLSVWDRLFGTYVAQPAGGHEAMQLGLEKFRDASEARLDRLLTQPFRER